MVARASQSRPGKRLPAGIRTAPASPGSAGAFRPARSLFSGPVSRSDPSACAGQRSACPVPDERWVTEMCRLGVNSLHCRAFPFPEPAGEECAMSAAYIFDVEGTLIDCVPDVLKSWSETLAAFGVSVSAADLQLMSGMDGDEMLGTLVPGLDEHARNKILTAQGERYRAVYLPRVRAFPGVRAAFTAIKSRGGRIAFATDCQS